MKTHATMTMQVAVTLGSIKENAAETVNETIPIRSAVVGVILPEGIGLFGCEMRSVSLSE
jgi:hypothetical protein